MPSTDSSRSQSAPSQPASFAPAKRSDHASSVKPAKRTARPSSSVSAKLPACGTGNEARQEETLHHLRCPSLQNIPARPIQRSSSGVILRLHGAPICSILSSDGFRAKRRPRVGRIVLSIFLVLILALGIGVFSAWNWVDDQLNKQTWLTSKADTAGESWLILSSDEREGTIGDAGDVEGFRTDTILVLTKPKTGSSSLISIPRDSLVEIDGSYMKINAVAAAVQPQTVGQRGGGHHRPENQPCGNGPLRRTRQSGRCLGRRGPMLRPECE